MLNSKKYGVGNTKQLLNVLQQRCLFKIQQLNGYNDVLNINVEMRWINQY